MTVYACHRFWSFFPKVLAEAVFLTLPLTQALTLDA